MKKIQFCFVVLFAIGFLACTTSGISIAEEKGKPTFKERMAAEKAKRAEKAANRADQDKPYVFTKVHQIDLSKKEIILHIRAYIAEKFVSAKSVIEISDLELGKLVGDISLRDPEAGWLSVYRGINARIMFDAKDGKYRLKATNVVNLSQEGLPEPMITVEGGNRQWMEPMANRLLNDFADEVQKHLISAKSGDDW